MDKITDIMNQMVKVMIEQDIETGKIIEIVLNKYNKAL